MERYLLLKLLGIITILLGVGYLIYVLHVGVHWQGLRHNGNRENRAEVAGPDANETQIQKLMAKNQELEDRDPATPPVDLANAGMQ